MKHQLITPSCKRIAVARLHLEDITLCNQVLELDEQGKVVSYQDLKSETCATIWLKGDFYLSENKVEHRS
ncbi:hypothetical protein EII14_07400 [Alloprevotella sp. OH1205_COT-284]|uniref:hypothetical protein n=1 Tax=Alloprevotella sp. OH1205_COT-284 TaxID=2491043 RepID=UPI000F5FBFA6|nr:hypothetical protein [Alloprevotella sp. OH1205_COT-284]RRD77406.1 hypothetical protein EII14_07400 [Alloprevotella sp. OH1205_COT-284]